MVTEEFPRVGGDGGRYYYLPGASTKADVEKALEDAGFKLGDRFRDAVAAAAAAGKTDDLTGRRERQRF